MSGQYPIAERIPPGELEAEIQRLKDIKTKPPLLRLGGYLRLGGSGFMDSALTLGAGTLTAAMLSETIFGYRTMWILWVSMGSGMFMMAAGALFAFRGGTAIIAARKKYHGWMGGSLMTALIGNAAAAVTATEMRAGGYEPFYLTTSCRFYILMIDHVSIDF